jgi:hypothetical protein
MTIMSIAGHVSKHMLEHYSRIRVEAKRAALDAIAGPVFEVGVHQNVHQIQTGDSGPSAKSLNRMVGTTGFEPATSRTPSVRATRLRHVPTSSNQRITGVREGSRWRAIPRVDRARVFAERGKSKADV